MNAFDTIAATTTRWHLITAIGCGLISGVLLDRVALDGPPQFALIDQAWRRIERSYVDRTAVQPQTLTYEAIAGMVDALGDTGHSRFLSPLMVKQVAQMERNKFEGIGAELQMKDGRATVLAPLDGSPAQRAGIQPGNVILKVNGQSVSGLPLDQIVERILGKAGTQVTLTILDPRADKMRDVTLVRATIVVRNVFWRPVPGTAVAHLRIAEFSHGLTHDLRRVLGEIEKAKLRGVILDLRNNPGGLLDEAVTATSEFLAGGNVLLERDAHGQTKPIAVRPGGVAVKWPLVVLVNTGTASAAEIMTGALQDAHRAQIVGATTIGTGTVLQEFDLPDGSALLLAVEEWLTPAGHVIWHKGITPDVPVSLPDGAAPVFPELEQRAQDPQLQRALELLR